MRLSKSNRPRRKTKKAPAGKRACPLPDFCRSRTAFLQFADLADKNKKSEPSANWLQIRISPIWKGRSKKIPASDTEIGDPIEAQRSGFDGEKEEGGSGYGVFAALTETAETEWSSLLPTWKGRTKKMPTFSSAFGEISPGRREQYHSEAKTVSPVSREPYHLPGEDHIICLAGAF